MSIVMHRLAGNVAISRRAAWTDARVLQRIAIAIVTSSVVFNAVLAIINGHLFQLSGGIVAVLQAGLTFAALAVGILSARSFNRWVLLIWMLVIAFIALSLLRGSLSPKNFGDILIIPAFIAVGQAIKPASVIKMVTGLQCLIVAVGIFELAAPSAFATTFKVVEYYVSTRGFDKSIFWAGNDLFLSSERPGGRLLFGGLGLHRGSSLFLEPVSLGNWVVVAMIVLLAFWQDTSWRTRLFLVVTNLVLLVVCDGRLAMGVVAILAVYVPLIGRRLSSPFSALYLPGIFLALAVMSATGHLSAAGDTLAGRLHGGFDSLVGLDLFSFMGLGDELLNADAGWVYFIQTQSLLVALGMWFVITLTSVGEDGIGRTFKHSLTLFLALCLPISYSVLSIKTMSVLWAAYGCLYARRAADVATEVEHDHSPRFIYGFIRPVTASPALNQVEGTFA